MRTLANSLPQLLGFGLLLLSSVASAHNGSLGLAYPVENITVDGDFSDWPEGIPRFPILAEYISAPKDSLDFQASFRAGYSETENALYVAVEVRDESIVPAGTGLWNEQDGCELYVEVDHGEGTPGQYRMYGDQPSAIRVDFFLGESADFDVAVQRTDSGHRYEWRVGVGQLTETPLSVGREIGFDVTVCDRDEDGTFTWMAWGQFIEKYLASDRVGDVLLVAGPTDLSEALILAADLARKRLDEAVGEIEEVTSYQMFTTGALLAFSLLHLLLFLFYPKSRENLYFATYAAAIAAGVFVLFQFGFTLGAPEGRVSGSLTIIVGGMWIIAGVVGGADIVYKVCHIQRPRHYLWFSWVLWISWSLLMIWLGYKAATSPANDPGISAEFFLYFKRATLAVVLLVLAEMLRVTMGGFRRREQATWIVGIGFSGLVVVLARLLYLQQVDYSIFVGIGSLLISMSIYLAKNIARTSKDLEVQLEQVRELSEKTLEQNRQIQVADRHKSDFLARMSHDLRTPMNAIIGYTRILMRRLRGEVEERQFQNLANIDTSAHHLLDLINDILDLSKIEAGRIEITPQNVDLRQLIGQCLSSVSPLIRPDVRLQEDLNGDGAIHTDPDRLRRVLMNVLSNAVKFTERGSITVSLHSDNGWHQAAVADTGPGISADDLPHIFEEFRQASDRAPTTQEGTGLGLSIARKSVELLGGTIAAESTLGQGTVFTLRVPDYRAEHVA